MSPKQALDKIFELSQNKFVFPEYFRNFINNSQEPIIKDLVKIIYQDPKTIVQFLSAYGKRCPNAEKIIINKYSKIKDYINPSDPFFDKLLENYAKLISEYTNNLSDQFHDRWNKAEEILLKGKPHTVYLYFKSLKRFFGNQWPQAETVLCKKMSVFHQYVLDCEKPNQTYEQKILDEPDNKSNAKYIYEYATKILKNRWTEAEHIILKNKFYSLKYVDKFNLTLSEEDHNKLLAEVAFDDKCPNYKKQFLRRKK